MGRRKKMMRRMTEPRCTGTRSAGPARGMTMEMPYRALLREGGARGSAREREKGVWFRRLPPEVEDVGEGCLARTARRERRVIF